MRDVTRVQRVQHVRGLCMFDNTCATQACNTHVQLASVVLSVSVLFHTVGRWRGVPPPARVHATESDASMSSSPTSVLSSSHENRELWQLLEYNSFYFNPHRMSSILFQLQSLPRKDGLQYPRTSPSPTFTTNPFMTDVHNEGIVAFDAVAKCVR